MSISIATAVTSAPVNINTLLAEADAVSADAKKDAKIERQIRHEKSMTALDKSISTQKKQLDKAQKAARLNFVLDMVSGFLNMITQAINYVAPGAGGAVASVVNGAFQGTLTQIGKVKNNLFDSQKAEIKTQKLQKIAEKEKYLAQKAGEELEEETENQRIVRNRLEKALQDMQDSQQATLKV